MTVVSRKSIQNETGPEYKRYEAAKEFLDVDEPDFPRPGINLIETTESNLDRALKIAAGIEN